MLSETPKENLQESPEDSNEGIGSFLTKRQLQVLKLRVQGCSQQKVADLLGTTRSNVSILEKRAYQNISRAERTLQQWMMIQAPISLKVMAGTDVFKLPSMIFQIADENAIQLPITSLDIIVQLKRKASHLFRRRAVLKDVEIYVSSDGELHVIESVSR
ncbi:MAG: Tfx family DNA-binding protein [Methanotrichaceae archaeon]|nr:Tfx family DNA-binding protein [Methanotrichaceae archaeon]